MVDRHRHPALADRCDDPVDDRTGDPTRSADKVARPRKCLICASQFPSAWAGERVCRRCKASTRWRQQ
jgi:hypothetical protein